MGYGDNNNGLTPKSVIDAVGETIDQTASEIVSDGGLQFRISRNKAEGFIDFTEERTAKANSLLFIPGKSLIQLLLCCRKKYDPHLHVRYFSMTSR